MVECQYGVPIFLLFLWIDGSTSHDIVYLLWTNFGLREKLRANACKFKDNTTFSCAAASWNLKNFKNLEMK